MTLCESHNGFGFAVFEALVIYTHGVNPNPTRCIIPDVTHYVITNTLHWCIPEYSPSSHSRRL